MSNVPLTGRGRGLWPPRCRRTVNFTSYRRARRLWSRRHTLASSLSLRQAVNELWTSCGVRPDEVRLSAIGGERSQGSAPC